MITCDPISIPGFMEPKEIEPILKYFGDGAYKTQSFRFLSQLLKHHGKDHVKILRSCKSSFKLGFS